MKATPFLLVLIFAVGYSNCFVEDDLKVFSILKDFLTIYQEKYLKATGEVYNKVTTFNHGATKKFLTSFGVTLQEIHRWTNQTYELIAEQRALGIDPACLDRYKKTLDDIKMSTGEFFQNTLRGLFNGKTDLYNSYFYTFLLNLEDIVTQMSIETFSAFGRQNPTTSLNKITRTLTNQAYGYREYFGDSILQLSQESNQYKVASDTADNDILAKAYAQVLVIINNVLKLQDGIRNC